MNKILSICIPTYHRAGFLDETLSSIFKQFNKDIINNVEIIISNNNSPDNTDEVVKKYRNKYPNNIKYFKNEKNIGWIRNVIKVTEYASWKYLWLLTDDDCLTHFALNYVLEIIRDNTFDLMLSKALWFEKLPVHIPVNKNTIHKFDTISSYIEYLYDQNLKYYELNSFFSSYSINIVKNELFKKALYLIWDKFTKTNFPHSYIIYSIIQWNIIISDNILILGRSWNESYSWSIKLIKDLKEIFLLIENKNVLSWNKKWNFIKNKCMNAWRVNMILSLLLYKIWIDYKKNCIFKRLYPIYIKIMKLIFR